MPTRKSIIRTSQCLGLGQPLSRLASLKRANCRVLKGLTLEANHPLYCSIMWRVLQRLSPSSDLSPGSSWLSSEHPFPILLTFRNPSNYPAFFRFPSFLSTKVLAPDSRNLVLNFVQYCALTTCRRKQGACLLFVFLKSGSEILGAHECLVLINFIIISIGEWILTMVYSIFSNWPWTSTQ